MIGVWRLDDPEAAGDCNECVKLSAPGRRRKPDAPARGLIPSPVENRMMV